MLGVIEQSQTKVKADFQDDPGILKLRIIPA